MRLKFSSGGNSAPIPFAAEPPTSYADAKRKLRPELSSALHLALRRAGVITIPGGFGRIFVSFAHDDMVIDRTIAAFERAASELATLALRARASSGGR